MAAAVTVPDATSDMTSIIYERERKGELQQVC
jgi:hypothetical protein